MIRQLALLPGLATLLAACTTSVKVPEIPMLDAPSVAPVATEPVRPSKPAKVIQYVEVPKPLPLPGQLKPVTLSEDVSRSVPPEARVASANAAARVEPVKDGYINAIQVYPFTAGALYQVYAAVNQVTDITLEPGEKLVAVSAGDTVRWVVADTTSGEGSTAQVHILVKPVAADLETNLVITSDRRTYHLELRSSAKTYMASVSWAYPAAGLVALKGRQAADEPAKPDDPPAVDQLHFRYRIEGDAPWKPLRVYDDGARVYIQFPSGLAQGEAPPLFVIGGDGKPALVNYRVRGATYIVDRLFAAAELRLGTAPQRVVRIVRTDAVWREITP